MPFKDNETQRTYKREWYKKNKAKVVSEVRNRKRKIAAWLLEMKSQLKCSRCSEEHIATLDFHHSDPSRKEMLISSVASSGWGREKILEEISKCEILCANCHRKCHWDMKYSK